MTTLQDVRTWRGTTVLDAAGEKIGTVEEVFLDRHTGEPAWATVKTGLFGLKHSFVPIRDAEQTGDKELRVPVRKEQVKDGPRVDAKEDLSPEDERRLYEHYGLNHDEWQGEDRTVDMDLPADEGGDSAPGVVGVRLRRVVVIVREP